MDEKVLSETSEEEKVEKLPENIPAEAPLPFAGLRYRREKKLRGIGFTRKSKSETKKAGKLAKKMRAVNVARKNKKFRPTGSKRRK